MSATSHDAVVIGGGTSGLVAATLLAKAGLMVVLFEAHDTLGGTSEMAPLLYALDPEVVRRLRLPRHGLKFALRDPTLVGLAPGGPLVLGRDVHGSSRATGRLGERDALNYPRFRHETLALARALRAIWWDGAGADEASLSASNRRALEIARNCGIAGCLDGWFESPALKAALAYDGTAGGLSIDEPPSALAFHWRRCQEMCGLQGAAAQPVGGVGGLVACLASAARTAGVEVRTGAPVVNILVEAGRVRGVVLPSGEDVPATLALSSLSRSATRALAPTGSFGLAAGTDAGAGRDIATTRIEFSFDRSPEFGVAAPARFIVVERPDSLVAAHRSAMTGRLPDEPVFEAVVTAQADRSKVSLVALVRPVPVELSGGWQVGGTLLAAKVLAALDAIDRGLKDRMTDLKIVTPADLETQFGSCGDMAPSVARLLSSAAARSRTPVEGLLLCGAAAEPMGAISGRAARHAAELALAQHRTKDR